MQGENNLAWSADLQSINQPILAKNYKFYFYTLHKLNVIIIIRKRFFHML